MNAAFALVVPAVILLAAFSAIRRREDVFAALSDGAGEGLRVMLRILPPLVGLLTAVYMLRASGAMDALSSLCAPALRFLGIPRETAALVFIRPISGSGALAVGSELIAQYGADSYIGRAAAIMLGSTETTFYTVAVYFGAIGIKKTRYAIPAALVADLTGFAAASLAARIFYPG
ncbi:MAG: spore maturation protein [Oscillospiraceae bacterium]|jgi:spore maturation protein B|nr:spore maturation protein [Oscillospiraceae bacterium]